MTYLLLKKCLYWPGKTVKEKVHVNIDINEREREERTPNHIFCIIPHDLTVCL